MADTEKTLGPEHPDTLTSVNSLAGLYRAQGRYAEAESLYKRGLADTEKALGPEHPDTLRSVNNLGLLYQEQGRYGEAEPLYKRALSLAEKVLGLEHPSTLTSVNNLGLLYQAQGRYSKAELLLKRAVADSEKALGPQHPDTLKSVNNLGVTYQAQGRYGEAEPLLQRTLAGYEKALGPEHPNTLTSVNNLAVLAFAQRDWRGAAQLWRRSTAAIARRVQRGILDAGPTGKKKNEAERLDWQFWGLVKSTYRLGLDNRDLKQATFAEMFQTAQWALSSEAARALTQMAARGAKGDPKLAVLVRERQDKLNEWQSLEVRRNATLGQEASKRDAKAEAENAARMTAIDKRIAEIDARLRAEFPDYFALAGQVPLSVEEVRAQLGAGEALVLFLDTPEWLKTPGETFIWIVTKTEVRWVRSDLGKKGLAREVAALRCGLDRAAWEGQSRCPKLTGRSKPGRHRPLPFNLARAHRLYKALVGGAEELIKDKRLLIVPSGALTQLPFAALVTAPSVGEHKTVAWLARDHAITMLPAISSLKALRATGGPSAAAKPLIGFGNPLLNGPNGRYATLAKLAREKQACPKSPLRHGAALFGFRQAMLPIDTRSGLADVSLIRRQAPLPETADELCAVASDIGADVREIRLGARATESEVKAMSESGALADYRIVHFATHGAMAGELSSKSEPGLILTPPDVASEKDDGYLTASEIAGLKLDADWVILSACNTAAGNTSNAEALSGLASAFIYAQARALLVSHWAVDSNATVKLITTAMNEITRNRSVGRAEALRRAMLALIDGGDTREAHPAYWAPFIVVGKGGVRVH